MNDSPVTPASMLANVIKRNDIHGIWLISGDRRVGKTTWCSMLARQAQAAGWNVGGLITPAVFSGGEKIGFDLFDISSGIQRRFGISDQAHSDWIKIGNWRIDPKVLAWANHRLTQCRGCDILILDELGPLELKENQGFIEGIRLLDERSIASMFVVVRLELIPEAQKRWSPTRILEITKENNDQSKESFD